MNGSPGSKRVGSGWSQASTSSQPASASQPRVSSGSAKNTSPVQPSPIVASTARTEAVLPTPPYWATSCPPGRVTAARWRYSAAWSWIQWNVAVERIASTGFIDRERAPQVRLDELDPIAEPGEASAGLVEHRRGAVEGDDAATGHGPAGAP